MALTDGHLPNDQGVYAGGPYERAEYKAASGGVTPGAVLISGATDGECAEAGAGAVAILGVCAENYNVGAATFRTDIDAAKRVLILTSPGVRFMGILKPAGAALVAGDLLKTAAGGKLEKWDSAVDDGSKAVARFIEKADRTPHATNDEYALCALVKGGA